MLRVNCGGTHYLSQVRRHSACAGKALNRTGLIGHADAAWLKAAGPEAGMDGLAARLKRLCVDDRTYPRRPAIEKVAIQMDEHTSPMVRSDWDEDTERWIHGVGCADNQERGCR